MSKKVVIIGGVAAGASTAARLRRLDESAQIIMFERGEYISYANCGLPYYIGDVIESRSELLLQTPEAMSKKFNMDIRIKQEVMAIDRKNKTVTVKKADSGETYTETYDTLVLATGSSPLKPPIPGIESDRVHSLWTVPDTDRIKEFIKVNQVKRAIVIGGGFIGIEMAENLKHTGCEVALVELLDQVLTQFDYEMAQLIHEELEKNGISLYLNDGVASFADSGSEITATLKSGKEISADMVIMAAGVRANSELAKAAGLELNMRGGVVTDEYLRTSDPDIYAAGDSIEVENFIDSSRTMIPLAGPANRQGRICADNICGLNETYKGSQGTSIVKVFDIATASTGLSEKALNKQGLVRGKDYEVATIIQNSHAGYYPGATYLTIKLVFSADGKKLFGAQIVGQDGVDKRIDVIATAIRLNGSIFDLKSLELAYAPPFSSAKDPVNMAGFTAENIINKKAAFCRWDALDDKTSDFTILDVREDLERLAYAFPDSLNIPLSDLRVRLNEIDKQKQIIVFCAVGVRAYNAARILQLNGFDNVYVYPGGTKFYRSTHYKAELLNEAEVDSMNNTSQADAAVSAIRVDCSGLQCPGPIMKVFETVKSLQEGQMIEVHATDPGFSRDINAWCRRTGNTLVKSEKHDRDYVVYVKKGISKPVNTGIQAADVPQGKTIVVFSGDLDKVLASFIIANGSAAMGRPVTMFFTFWGLNVLRKPTKQRVKKTFIEAMFGSMMPRGAKKLKLSKLNMGGMGTAMMKLVMKDKNINTLEELIQKAIKGGVKIVACTMSMDVMGIKAEELIDGVELGGVGAYLGDAEESNVNLFI